MTQNAVVTKIIDSLTAEIAVARQSACGGNCHACGGTCASKSRMTVTAINKAAAAVGDRVVVSSKSAHIIGITLLVYIVPLVLFFIGYAAAALAGLGEKLSIIISLTGLFAGIGIVIVINQVIIAKRNPVTFEIVSILS